MRVSGVRYTPAPDHLVPTGLLGWVSFLIEGQVRISGVAVRAMRGGRLALSYPSRDDGYGKRWDYLRPIDDETRVAIERQVLAEIDLGREGVR